MSYEKYKEEMSLGFYQQLKNAMRKGQRVSINAVGFKNLTGTIKKLTRYAVMLDRGQGLITIINMNSIRMITIYPNDYQEDEEDENNE